MGGRTSCLHPRRAPPPRYHVPVPFEEHPVFKPPKDAAAPLFRYMDLGKFVSLLERRALFFTRSDRLGDTFEGSLTKANLELRPELFAGIPEAMWPKLVVTRRQMRFWTFINCWTSSSTESVAMWRLYVGDGNGLAVESTYERLIAAIGGELRVFVGSVQYADWNRSIIPEGNMLTPFLYKRIGFEYEREIRAIIQDLPIVDKKVDWSHPLKPGLTVPVDVTRLVTRIRLSPVTDHWYREVVESVIEKYGYAVEVTQSDLAGDPVF